MATHDSFPFFNNDTMDEEFLLENSNQSFNQQQRPQQILAPFPPSMIIPDSNSPLDHSLLMNPLPSLMEKQNEKMDQYLRLQNEQLIYLLNMQTKQHMESLLTKLESKASILLRWKEEELASATIRAQALQDCASRAEEEKEMWKKIALEKEAMALALKAALERVQEHRFVSTGALGTGAGNSYFSFPRGRKEDNEQTGETGRAFSLCKLCGNRDSCMLFLPCQHLCACKECEASLSECPLCNSPKIRSLEVLFV